MTSTQSVPEAELRQKLIDEVKKQGKPYGLYFDDIQGGFTLTTRSLPQAFPGASRDRLSGICRRAAG